MKSKLLAIIAIAVLFAPLSNAVAAETPQWFLNALKVKNPNELPIRTLADEDCPFAEDEMGDIVSGVLFRSRVKPLPVIEVVLNSLYLFVQLSCIEEEGNQTYTLSVYFGKISGTVSYLIDWPYGTFGRNDKAGMTTVIKGRVEAAITDFIKANLDL